jgi:hypothetical protein
MYIEQVARKISLLSTMKHQSSNQFNILKQKVADKLWPKYVPSDPSHPRSPPLLLA